jgi:type I restriction enzyme S subunit
MSVLTATPTAWSKRRLRFDAKLNPLKSKLNLPPETEVSFVPMEAIGELGGLQLTETRALEDVYNGYTYFANGDVCLAKITPCFENGKIALAQELTNGVAFGTTELHVIRPQPTVDANFLFYLMVSHDFRSYGEAEMLGAGGQKRVPEEFIKNWRAPLPFLETQRRIARFLDEKTARIDGLIEKKHALLERLAEKRQALITHAVIKGLNPDAPMKPSGIDWLGDIPAHWEVVPFKWRCRVQSGQVDPREPGFADMPLIAPDHIESGTGRLFEITSAEEQGAISGKYHCPPGSVLYSKIRPALRKAALFQSECLCSADMYAIDPRNYYERRYLLYFLLTDAFTAYAELESLRVAMPKVNRDALGAFPMPVPDMKEQNEIASFCFKKDQEHRLSSDQIKLSIKKLGEYRAALITAAVSGQLEGLQ